jgi:glycosyltransferase involved in cell wall biosynthesis
MEEKNNKRKDMETITAVITYSPKHIKLVNRAIASIKDQVHRISVVYDHPKKGQAYRLNQLIYHAKTDWICFQDADDISFGNRIEIVKPAMPYSDLIYTDTQLFKSQPFDLKKFKRKHFIPFPTILVRTKIAKKIPFPNIGKGNDYVWLRRVYKEYSRFIYIPVITVWYNPSSSNYSNYGNIPVIRKLKRLWFYHKLEKLI